MCYVDHYLAELSRTIDPKELGRRIRNARVAAGMTQAAVASDEVTAAYLSRIEDGQRRPEFGLLQRMAERMGTTLEVLLATEDGRGDAEVELALDHAELALVSGDSTGALAQSDQLLKRLEDRRLPALVKRALRVRAGALEATGDLNAAIVVLEDLTAAPTPDAEWLKSLIALSRCYRDNGEYAKAIAVGTRTAAVIDELGIGGLTEAIQLTVTVSWAHKCVGDLDEAMRMCMRALEAAEKYDSPIAKASAYWNASSIQATADGGASPAAIEMAKKALAIFELGEDNRNLARLKLEVANLHVGANPPQPEVALEMLAGVEVELDWSGGSAFEKAFFYLLRGKAHAMLGDFDSVAADIGRARALMPAQAPMLRAMASALEGQVAVAEGESGRARELYRQAVMELTGAGVDRDAAELWFELANLLTEVGDAEAAVEAFRSAGAAGGFRMVAPTALPVKR